MSSPVFTLSVPPDPEYRTLACDVARRYVELMGEGEPGQTAFVVALSDAMERLAGGHHINIELVCRTSPTGLDVTVRRGEHSTVVHHALPVRKHGS